MDQPDLDIRRLRLALTGLARLNSVSRSVAIVARPITALAAELGRPITVLDVATGGGDLPVGLWRRARRTGTPVQILGIDVNPHTIEIARARAAISNGAVRFTQGDALNDELPGMFDVVVCSLFLHHLDNQEVVPLLAKMAAATRHLLLANDLVRSRPALLGVSLAARLLTTSPIVWTDAPRSVRAAFTLRELNGFAQEVGLSGARVSRRFPCRMLLEWRRR
jgi:2-polyprenyl-3-methyl-5-hydroxy-6-metoxy-1,4-benzoquinol methylase